MTDFPTRFDFSDVSETHIARIFDWFRHRIDVLVVVDSEIQFSEPGGFGVGRFIRLLRETQIGCTSFNVDIALRNGSAFADNGSVAAGQVRYVGYRFDSAVGGELVLDRYDEAFLFGFKPGNTNGPDAEIHQASAFPASDGELASLAAWMNAGGGVFATGDHDFLGASMCHRVPRIGTMRKWTNAQGVPPQFTPARLDTNQPVTAGQLNGTEVIPGGVEQDATPQRIDWVPERVINQGWLVRWKRPHEILCHPTLGPIDVMPDHPHEGCCIERSAIDATRTIDFGDGAFDEYPEVGGARELPKVIAYGDVVPDPPFQHNKGDCDPFRIAMISAYDGHRAGVGRAVTDSTWHHWMNLNVLGLEGAPDQSAWQKVSRYFVNVAKWIARPGAYKARCWWEVLWSHFDYPGIEEYRVGAHWLELGTALRQRLIWWHGPCTVAEFVLEGLELIDARLREYLEERAVPKWPMPDPCLSCPPFDVIEAAVLGGFVEGTRPLADRLKAAIEAGETKGLSLDAAEIEEAALRGASEALRDVASMVVRSARDAADVFESLAGSDGRQSAS